MVVFFSALRGVFDKMSVVFPSEKAGIPVVTSLNRGIHGPVAGMAIPATMVDARVGVKKSIPPRGARRDAKRT